MAYMEIKERNENKYYYLVRSVRRNNQVSKDRIYLGVNLDKETLLKKKEEANKDFKEKKVNKTINKLKEKLVPLIKRTGIKRAGIFGSYARGEQKASSDIDILIEPTKEIGFFEIIELEEELKKTLKKKIDLLTYASIHNLLRERILHEEVRIL